MVHRPHLTPIPNPSPVNGGREQVPSLFMGGVIALLFLMMAFFPTDAQGTCPTATTFTPPVDPSTYQLVQDFAARSVRHDGRYHTGEDWALPDGASRGQPVRAIASGQVTYAYGSGWGRDGGVVILEHTLPDDMIVYSVYGHIQQTEAVRFPSGGACVMAGDIIGVIGDARPAPHLHFEVRRENGRTPGVGYSLQHPAETGHLRPSAFLTNWIARQDRSVAWVTVLRDERPAIAPPLPLADNSLLILTSDYITRILPDGRAFWRTRLDRPAVAVTGFSGQAYLIYTDGTIQEITPDGNLGERWRVPFVPIGAPFPLDSLLVFPAQNGLTALSANRREMTWEAAGVPPFIRAQVAGQLIALETIDGELFTLSRANLTTLDRAAPSRSPALATAPDGSLVVYGSGGLWRVLADGAWSLYAGDYPLPTAYGGVAFSSTGDMLLFDGAAIQSYTRDGVAVWSRPVDGVAGRVMLTGTDGGALLVSSTGDIVTASPRGVLCARQVWTGGSDDAVMWSTLSDDGLLRVVIGETVTAVNWGTFTTAC